jgi:hypothetical protein
MWRLNSPIHPRGFTAKLPYIVEENGESQDLLTWLPKRRSDIISITRYWDNSQHPAALCRRVTQYGQFLSLLCYITSKNYSFPNFPCLGGLTCLFCYKNTPYLCCCIASVRMPTWSLLSHCLAKPVVYTAITWQSLLCNCLSRGRCLATGLHVTILLIICPETRGAPHCQMG